MKAWRILLGWVMALAGAASLGAQTPVLSNIEAPYPAVQGQVKIAGVTYGSGSVAYGPAGTFLEVTGEDLGASGTVQFTPYQKQNNQEVAGTPVQATVSMWSSTLLFLNVPTGASSGLITVTTEGRTSNGLPFIVTPGSYSGSCQVSPPNSQLQIMTLSLQNGKTGQPYSTTLTAEGGQTAYSWSIVSGALPGGLSLNAATGTISGTPSGPAGPVDLSVQVKDSSSPAKTDDTVLTLTIDAQTLTAATIYSYSVGHDYVGNVTSYSDATYSGSSIMGTWSYGYDSLNRLESGTATAGDFSGQSACWAYDSFGNRIDQATSNQPFQSQQSTESCQPATGATLLSNVQNTYTVNGTDPGTNQVQSTNASGTSAAVSYDAAGNVVADGENRYLYDADGRLCAEASPAPPSGGPSPMTGYLYDAEGNRIAKGTITSLSCDVTANGFAQSETYVLGQGGEELTQLDGGGNWQRTNVYAAGALIGTYDTTGLHFQLTDALGTRRMQASYQGQPETECQSWPYGDGLYCYPDTYAPPSADDATPLHFTGKERDQESGNDYFEARYYANSMGRFMSPDWSAKEVPIPYAKLDNPQSFNLYLYVGNNPLARFDPDGHKDWCAGSNASSLACSVQTDWNKMHDVASDQTKKVKGKVANYLGQHQTAVKVVSRTVIAVTIISGVIDAGASELAVPEEVAAEAALESATSAAGEGTSLTTTETYVIGSKADPLAYSDQSGYNVLNIPQSQWSPEVNSAWVQSGIDKSACFLVCSPQTGATLYSEQYGRTVFATELDQLNAAGYTQVGNMMVPPGIN